MFKLSDKHLTILICLAIVLSTLVVFGQICRHEFISFDDDWYIYDNSHINTGLSIDNILWTFTRDHAGNFHPLTSITHMLDCDIFGLNAGGHHFNNLLIHLASAVLLFLVLKSMTKSIWASAFVAALFALHPLHVESVAWASERKDVLCAFFAFLTLAAYTRYSRKPNLWFYLLTLALFGLGLLSKPMLVTLPILLLLFDYWPFSRLNSKFSILNSIIEKIPFLALSVIISIITFSIQKDVGIVQDLAAYSLSSRIENSLVAYMNYIYKLFAPVNLAIFYPFPPTGWSSLRAGGAFLLLLCITILVLWLARKRPWLAVGWFWFVISLIPVIGLVQVGLQTWADRYTYLSYTGLFIIIAWGVPQLLPEFRYKKQFLASSAVLLLLVLAILTSIQAGYWQNNITLYQHATKAVKNNWWAHRSLGQEYAKQGKLDQAQEQFAAALAIFPDNGDIKIDLAETLVKLGKYDQAIELYQGFLEPLPEDLDIRQSTDPEMLKQRRFTSVLVLFAKAHLNFASALLKQEKFDQSVLHYTSAIQLDPTLAPAVKDAADSLLKKDRPENALKLYRRVLSILPQDIDAMDKLAIAYAATGRFPQAIETAEIALKLARESQQKDLALAIQTRLNLYKTGQPYIEPATQIPSK